VVVVGPFYELAVDERGASSDERHEMWAVDCAPAVLGGLDELERHGQARRPRAGAAGDFRAVSDGGEGGLDRYLELAG